MRNTTRRRAILVTLTALLAVAPRAEADTVLENGFFDTSCAASGSI